MPLIIKEQPFSGSLLGVWHITESSDRLEEMCGLPGEDLARLRQFRNDLRKRQWIACRMILAECGIPAPMVSYDAAGKPFLEGSLAHISFSHSGNYAAAIWSADYRVGVDIEVPRERILRVADRFLHPGELARITEPNRIEKLYIYWCTKEAVFKLNGEHGVDFKEDLILDPFDYLCTGRGNGRALLKLGTLSRYYPVKYRIGEAFILVCAAEVNLTVQ